MQIPGKRVRRLRLVRSDKYLVEVEVDALIPDEDPSELCFDQTTVELLREVEHHAKAGDLPWLLRHGRVYAAVETA